MTGPDRTRAAALRAWCVRASSAAWGLALAAAMASTLQRPAPPGQLPGAMKAMGLDAAGPFLQLAALILVPFAGALAGALLVRHLAGAPRWMPATFCIALASAPLTLLAGGGLAAVLLHGVVAAAALGARWVQPSRDDGAGRAPGNAEPAPDGRRGAPPAPAPRRDLRSGFSRCDLLLIPSVLICYFAILDLAPAGTRPVTCLLAAAVLMLGIRAAAGRISSLRRPGLALAPVPLAVLLQLQWLPAGAAAIAALAWIAAAPLAVAILLRTPVAERRLRTLVALAIYPLFALAYPLALLGIDSPVGLDFYEDGHELLPAAEMLHGKRPYADIVPPHGLVSDGALDLLVMRSGHTSTGDLLRVRRVARCVVFPAIYAVALAATGAAEAGLLAVLLSIALFPGMGLRPAMALFVLAGAVTATRRRSLPWLAGTGAGAVLAFVDSPDFAVYSSIVAAVAALRSIRHRRGSAASGPLAPIGALAAGATLAAAAILATFAAMGFAGAFLRITFLELPRAGQTYVIGPLAVPDCLRTLATSPASWVQPQCVTALVWFLAVVATAAGFARAPLAAARGDGVWLIGLWIALAGASYAERRHVYASFAMAAFLVSGLFLLARQRARCAAVALALVVAWLANPLGHVFALATPLRASSRATVAGAAEIGSIPRCRGVLLDPALRPATESVARFVGGRLRAGETWFDFTNHSVLYYLFDRHCPMRHLEIPFVESAAAQREVVAMLERDHAVRAALVAFPDWFTAIDGVSNQVRAPLIWRYLEEHFSPAFADHGVVFWIRR
ncbi:MAG TPA: hypothetical protein VHB47_11910 [Thermoanaerobaculia bacterium]|jgi:hypothetical protein|nr:hypothetical protein [Thermoanaerobaculia bacterium]